MLSLEYAILKLEKDKKGNEAGKGRKQNKVMCYYPDHCIA